MIRDVGRFGPLLDSLLWGIRYYIRTPSFSITTDIQNISFFYFYFLAKELSLNIVYWILKFSEILKHSSKKRTVSQIFF